MDKVLDRTQDKDKDNCLEQSEVLVMRCGVYIDEGWLRMWKDRANE